MPDTTNDDVNLGLLNGHSVGRILKEAVRRAAALARPGDCVLLAPACSSLDMYKSYAERGDAFAEAARGLRAGDTP